MTLFILILWGHSFLNFNRLADMGSVTHFTSSFLKQLLLLLENSFLLPLVICRKRIEFGDYLSTVALIYLLINVKFECILYLIMLKCLY